MDIQEAVSYPRFHHQLIPNVLAIDKQFDGHIIKVLREKYGHEVNESGSKLPDGQSLGVIQVSCGW